MGSHHVILSREQINGLIYGRIDLLLIPRGDEGGARPPYRAGEVIPLEPAADAPARGTVAVRRVTDIALGELTDEDARRLGHRGLATLRVAWEGIARWSDDTRAWRLEVTPERPNWLKAGPGHGHGANGESGYTERRSESMPDEPEALDPDLVAAYGRAAGSTEAERFERLLRDRAEQPIAVRLMHVLSDAEARGLDITRDVFVIRQRIEKLERAVYRPADRAAT